MIKLSLVYLQPLQINLVQYTYLLQVITHLYLFLLHFPITNQGLFHLQLNLNISLLKMFLNSPHLDIFLIMAQLIQWPLIHEQSQQKFEQ